MQTPKPYKRPHYDTYKNKAQALKRKAKREQQPCWLCGQPINYNLPANHRDAYTADHTTPLANGGKPTSQLRPAHRHCNSRRGNNTNHKPQQIKQPKTTQKW